MKVRLKPAIAADAAPLAALHVAVAERLTVVHGLGPWSGKTSALGVRYAMRLSQVYAAWRGRELVGTLRLTTQKPWAIDASFFSVSRRPLYLLAMAVAPARQRQGIGRKCLEEARRIAAAWPADALRLDAYDTNAGGGGFYVRCGWTERGRAVYRGVPRIFYEYLLA